MTLPLEHARALASPRLAPPPTPLAAVLIHGGILALWIALFLMAFSRGGALAWSVGVAYIGYDTVLLLFVSWQTLALLRPPAAATAPATPGRDCCVGVIVAAHNEAAVLPVTLAALLAQQSPADLIVVADDGSTDGTAALLAAQYGLLAPEPGMLSAPSTTHPTLRWLRMPHGGKARTLNAAIETVDTEVVLTVDGDTLLEPGAIHAVRDAFAAEPGLVAVTGVITPVCGPSVSGRFFEWFQTYEYIRNFLSRYAWMRLNSLLLVSGAFAGYRRDALLAVGGFDPDCMVEDYELTHRLYRHAAAQGLVWHVRVLGGARARTDAPGTIPAFLRQRRRWFGGFLETQYWYRDMVGNRRYGWLGILMLPVKAVDTLQPLYGLTAFALLLTYVFTGQFGALLPAAGFITGKIVIDLAFHLWSVHLYRRWVGNSSQASIGQALLAALLEPFSFQILRHTGAALGWVSFLTGRRIWGKQRRVGLVK